MTRSRRRYGFILLGGIAGLALLLCGLFWARDRMSRSVESYADLPRVAVRRGDLHVTLTAAGVVDSAARTLIECELEKIQIRNDGMEFNSGGSSMILWLIPEGSFVKKGDIICELDSSDYEEAVIQQKLQVEEERADYRAAELKLMTAKQALVEFEEGLKLQSIQELEGRVLMAESNVQSLADRLEWTERMGVIGYVAPARLATERISHLRALEALRQARLIRENNQDYTIPQIALTLEAGVETAKSTFAFRQMSLARFQERLEQFEKQVENCTIRAPHDGMIVYAKEDDDDAKIQEGTTVRTKQDLFYLPDLDRMQVHTLIHESVIERVKPGMRTTVRVEGLSDRELEGRVTSIAPLPYRNRDWRVSEDVKQFIAKIQLHATPRGLRPGMTAGVEIVTAEKLNALLIPVEAVTFEDGREVCYVAGPEGVERRAIVSSVSSSEFLCVESGLEEGEEVILDPSRMVSATRQSEGPSWPEDDEAPPVAENIAPVADATPPIVTE